MLMNSERLLLVLDEGTSSTRALLYNVDGSLVATAQQPIAQHYPQPGWVEHDPAEIWARTLACGREMVVRAGGADRIAAIGITNQRETALAWDRSNGNPLARAIVWQDRRTSDACRMLREAGHEPAVGKATGLLLDPYFSATKWRWMLDHEPEAASAAASGTLALGTIESWLVWNLSGGAHVTDASNASRTLLLPLQGSGFDPGLCDLFGIHDQAHRRRAAARLHRRHGREHRATSPSWCARRRARAPRSCFRPSCSKAPISAGSRTRACSPTRGRPPSIRRCWRCRSWPPS
jgi:glycerol kinase